MVYRIDDTTAVSTLPTLPTDNIGTPGFFTGGSTGGQAATRVRFWWLNMVQEELAAIVLAAGLVLDKTNNGQVLAAIQKLISDAVENLDQALSEQISGYVSGTYGKSDSDYQILGLYQQYTTGRPVAVFNNGTTAVYNAIANYADVQTEAVARAAADTTLQSNLTAALTDQANENSNLAGQIGNCVSGILDMGSSDYALQGIHIDGNDALNHPVCVYTPSGQDTQYRNLAWESDITYTQTNLTDFQTQQADQNSDFSSAIAVCIPTNPGTGWNAIKNLTVENDAGVLTALDATGTTNTYAPCSAAIQSDTVSVSKLGGLVIQTFEASIDNANNGGAGSVTVTLPQALTKSIQFAKGNALGGTQGGTMWIPSVNVLPTSLTEVTIYADNLQDENWTAAVPVQVLVIGS